jgi:hypothetical protein
MDSSGDYYISTSLVIEYRDVENKETIRRTELLREYRFEFGDDPTFDQIYDHLKSLGLNEEPVYYYKDGAWTCLPEVAEYYKYYLDDANISAESVVAIYKEITYYD